MRIRNETSSFGSVLAPFRGVFHDLLGRNIPPFTKINTWSYCFFQCHLAERTPNRPRAIFGLARAAQAVGDNATARERYRDFLSIWKDADPDRTEVTTAKEFLAKKLIGEK